MSQPIIPLQVGCADHPTDLHPCSPRPFLTQLPPSSDSAWRTGFHVCQYNASSPPHHRASSELNSNFHYKLPQTFPSSCIPTLRSPCALFPATESALTCTPDSDFWCHGLADPPENTNQRISSPPVFCLLRRIFPSEFSIAKTPAQLPCPRVDQLPSSFRRSETAGSEAPVSRSQS